MKVICLGAAGFIGSHLTQRLIENGNQVIAIDIENEKIQEFLNHENLVFIQQDIRDPAWKLDEHVKDTDVVVDLIAHANPSRYLQYPLEVFHLNFTENLKIAEYPWSN